ncbi:MAG: anaerobic ribonucleoside-triphosphate reductase activating protein [Thermoprotei archaeon]|nr:MAG: anaerobic ribonucleoside-triphosphate reductase activating protein [Thermoprotei archaeon]
MKAIVAGFKRISLTDVHNEPTFTLWFCGCNLRCPFCHNWKLAIGDRQLCKPIDINYIIDKVVSTKEFITYLHITGGEPLLQYIVLEEIFQGVKDHGISTSLNSNLTFPDRIEQLLSKNLVDHIATDLKIPFDELSGLTEESSILWRKFVESLKVIQGYNITFELRIPVARDLTLKFIEKVLFEVEELLNKMNSIYCIVNPLVGEPLVNPRDRSWARRYCNPSVAELYRVAEIIKERIGCRVYVKKWWSFGS